MSNLRSLVLQSFKKLQRTRLKVFAGDDRALIAARLKINDEYKKNKHVRDEEAIKAMIKFGEDVEQELRLQVIQAKEVAPGIFEAKISPETVKIDNIMYNDKAVPIDGIPRKRKGGCCQEVPKEK